jgi:hypothetical protein
MFLTASPHGNTRLGVPMKALYIVVAVVIVLLGGVFVYLLLGPDSSDFFANKQTITEPGTITEMAAAYVDRPYPDDYNTTRVPGYVDNLSDKRFVSVTLEIQLLREDGDKAEVIEHTLEDIGPGARKTFDINAGTIGENRTAQGGIIAIVVVEE